MSCHQTRLLTIYKRDLDAKLNHRPKMLVNEILEGQNVDNLANV